MSIPLMALLAVLLVLLFVGLCIGFAAAIAWLVNHPKVCISLSLAVLFALAMQVVYLGQSLYFQGST